MPPADTEKANASDGIQFHVVEGGRLPAKKLGIEGFCLAMEKLCRLYPNRDEILARHRSGEHGPVPVRFRVD